MNKIEVKELSKNFGKLKVLDGITFHVKEGELLCIVGPSGCGKTTLLKIMARLMKHNSGEVLIEGVPSSPKVHRIGYVPQTISLLPWRTIYDNVKLGLEIKGVKGKEADRRVREAIRLVGLEGFEKYYPHQVSIGMMARAAIARALVIEPDVVLMDEPFANLDAQTRSLMQQELLRLHAVAGKTTVFVTHSVEEAILLADTLIILTNRPARVKKIMEVKLPRPRSKFNRAFIKLRKEVESLVAEEVTLSSSSPSF